MSDNSRKSTGGVAGSTLADALGGAAEVALAAESQGAWLGQNTSNMLKIGGPIAKAAGLGLNYQENVAAGMSPYYSFAEVIAAASKSSGNTVLDFGSLGTVTPTGVALTKLVPDDFVFG
ncbi:MAG: hypothetical protein ACKOED_10315 [Aestuariivirga sp.]|uniref:hypothetical protein n=1 Tax=Aestuariivirga sp. TaxID=2650926 RepID=UPI0038D0B0F4